MATPDLLREAGIEYACDWVNDDMPYAMRTRAGALPAMIRVAGCVSASGWLTAVVQLRNTNNS